MRNTRIAGLWLLVLSACPGARDEVGASRRPATAPSASLLPAARLTISVVATNDLHGHIEQLPLLGGYVANLRRARQRDAGGVLLLDAGDIFQGTLVSNLSEGAAAIRAFHALGYAAAALGNHEFDFGPVGALQTPSSAGEDPLGALAARVREARFPLLSANLRSKSGGPFPIPGVPASATVQVNGIRIAIVGGITEGALTRTHPSNTGGLSVAPLAASIGAEARRLREGGAQVVIAVVHAGGECRTFSDADDLKSCDPDSEVFRLAQALSPRDVDLIVAGHTHKGIAHRVHGIPVIESYSQGSAFGRVDLTVDRARRQVVGTRIHPPQHLCREALDRPICASASYEGAAVVRDSAVEQAIAPDLATAKAQGDRPLGVEVLAPLRREHDAESALGNLVVDLMRARFPGAAAAINNGGSIRTDIPAGPLTYGRLFQVFPFDNVFATLDLTAADLAALLAANLGNDRGFLALSGLRARARCQGPRLVVELFRENGGRVPPGARLRVITSDYLALGGDGLVRDLAPGRIDVHQGELLRDGLVKGLARFPKLDGRDPSLFDPARPRVRYAGPRPIRCPVSL